jgi:hypothetical protein
MELVVIVEKPSKNRTVALFDFGHGQRFEIYIEAGCPISELADPWLALALPLAMARGLDVRVLGQVSRSALDSQVKVQKELLAGHPYMKPIRVVAEEVVSGPNPKIVSQARRIGSFFSGGLDSTFTALSLPKNTELISVWGFDVPLSQSNHWEMAWNSIRKQAIEFGKNPMMVKTNIREMSDKFLDWGTEYNGAALAGIALALAPRFREVRIPGSYTNNYIAWGSFPTLDKSFSTDYLDISDHGLQVRIEKAQFVLKNGAMAGLRVCWQNKQGLPNCGKCSKCIRTRFECHWLGNGVFPKGLHGLPPVASVLKLNFSKGDYKFLKEDLHWVRQNIGGSHWEYRFLFFLVFTKSQLRANILKLIPNGARAFLVRKFRQMWP